MPLLLGAASGAVEIARNDDWSYRRIALELWQTGKLVFDNVAAPMLIGQILLVQPLLWLIHGDSLAFAIGGSDRVAVRDARRLLRRGVRCGVSRRRRRLALRWLRSPC